MKKSIFYVFGLLLVGAGMIVSCDDDGLTKGNLSVLTANHFTAYVQTDDHDSLMYFIDNLNGTASVTYDATNPLHRASESSTSVRVPYCWGERYIPEKVTSASSGKEYTVTAIGNEAFMGCWKMTAVDIPATVTSIGEGAFTMCSNLATVNIPDAVTEIPSTCFARCSSLRNTGMLHEGITSIGKMAFYSCTRLTAITLPEGIETIGERAFFLCVNSSLTSVRIPSTVKAIGAYAFGHNYNADASKPEETYSHITDYYMDAVEPPVLAGPLFTTDGAPRATPTVHVPAESVDAYKAAAYWKDLNIVAE